MFSLNNFIMKTLKGMVGNYPDFQVMEYALNWYSKGKLTEEDLGEVETLIEAQYIEPPVVEEPIDDIPTEEVEEETEIEDETILDGEEESQTETEIPEDSTNDEELPEVEPTEPTE
jgi:hypothetical protein